MTDIRIKINNINIFIYIYIYQNYKKFVSIMIEILKL